MKPVLQEWAKSQSSVAVFLSGVTFLYGRPPGFW
jgi:hypothetical protein